MNVCLLPTSVKDAGLMCFVMTHREHETSIKTPLNQYWLSFLRFLPSQAEAASLAERRRLAAALVLAALQRFSSQHTRASARSITTNTLPYFLCKVELSPASKSQKSAARSWNALTFIFNIMRDISKRWLFCSTVGFGYFQTDTMLQENHNIAAHTFSLIYSPSH